MSDPVVFALNLDYFENNHFVDGRIQGFRIAVKAGVKSGFRDALIFRYQKVSADEALFSGICSPSDINSLNENPSVTDGLFRADRFDLVFPNQNIALEMRDDILEEIEMLCCEMARIENAVSAPLTLEVSSE
jgi:hypothetical protein